MSGTTGDGGSHRHSITEWTGYWTVHYPNNASNHNKLTAADDSDRIGLESPSYTNYGGSHCHSFSGSATISGTTGSSGSGKAFSVVPSYYAVYMWRRYA